MYGKKYFDWQKEIGKFGASLDFWKFKNLIKENTSVLEFGCGGGYLLEIINSNNKIGLEINPYAAKEARKRKLNIVEKLNKIKDKWADVIISNHVLEHCKNPHDELVALRSKLKPNGIICFVVPSEKHKKFQINDINNHLYTWNELNLGNLFISAGYNITEIKTFKHAWPPYYPQIYNLLGEKLFWIIASIYGRLFSKNWEIRIVAIKS